MTLKNRRFGLDNPVIGKCFGLESDPENHVLLPALGYNPTYSDDHTIREIKCVFCGELISALIIHDVHRATFLWIPKVECRGKDGHLLLSRAKGEDANVVCNGRTVKGLEANEFISKFR
jgi:hypothetical protein